MAARGRPSRVLRALPPARDFSAPRRRCGRGGGAGRLGARPALGGDRNHVGRGRADACGSASRLPAPGDSRAQLQAARNRALAQPALGSFAAAARTHAAAPPPPRRGSPASAVRRGSSRSCVWSPAATERHPCPRPRKRPPSASARSRSSAEPTSHEPRTTSRRRRRARSSTVRLRLGCVTRPRPLRSRPRRREDRPGREDRSRNPGSGTSGSDSGRGGGQSSASGEGSAEGGDDRGSSATLASQPPTDVHDGGRGPSSGSGSALERLQTAPAPTAAPARAAPTTREARTAPAAATTAPAGARTAATAARAAAAGPAAEPPTATFSRVRTLPWYGPRARSPSTERRSQR